MEKVEEDLNRSKSLREKQAKDFSEQLAVFRQRYEQQVRLSVCLPVYVMLSGDEFHCYFHADPLPFGAILLFLSICST